MAVQRQEFYSQGPKSGAVLSIWFPPPARHWSNAPWNLWIWGGLPNDWPNLFITFLIKLPSDNLISGKYCKFWVLTTWCKWFRGWLKFHACGGCVPGFRFFLLHHYQINNRPIVWRKSDKLQIYWLKDGTQFTRVLTIMIATRFLDLIVGNNRFQSIFASIDHISMMVI